jgi:flagellar biosynthetic protein FlhB
VSGEKTEAPTARKLDQAHKKGQGIGRSHELSMTLTLGAGTLMLMTVLPGAATRLASTMVEAIGDIASPRDVGPLAMARVGSGFAEIFSIVLPLAFVVMLAGIAGQLASGGLVIALGSLRVDPGRINLISGLKRLFDKQALVRLGISLAKLCLLALVSWQVVASRVPAMVGLGGANAGAIAGSAMSAVLELTLTITLLLGGVALADMVLQRRKAQGSLKMTKDEVRREAMDQDGNPHIKGMRKRRARQMAFARMMDAVPTADVIVINPIRLAVALKYDSATMKAPRIVAKGQRLMAARIRDIARDHGVPIIEDIPLARALFSRPIGSDVPAHLYRAVARILVIVQQARANRRGSVTGRRTQPSSGRRPSDAPAAHPPTLSTDEAAES